jgi:hypothetical protein
MMDDLACFSPPAHYVFGITNIVLKGCLQLYQLEAERTEQSSTDSRFRTEEYYSSAGARQ